MTKEIATVKQAALETVATVKVDMADIVVFAVAQAEEGLKAKLVKQQAEVKAARTAIGVAQNAYDKALKAEGEAKMAEHGKNMVAALKPFGIVGFDVEVRNPENHKNPMQYRVHLIAKRKVDNGLSSKEFHVTKNEMMSKETYALLKNITTVTEAAQTAVSAAAATMSKLANIPAMERLYRSKVVAERMAQVEGGQAMIDRLQSQIEAELAK